MTWQIYLRNCNALVKIVTMLTFSDNMSNEHATFYVDLTSMPHHHKII